MSRLISGAPAEPQSARGGGRSEWLAEARQGRIGPNYQAQNLQYQQLLFIMQEAGLFIYTSLCKKLSN
jgi:hypothetical protein